MTPYREPVRNPVHARFNFHHAKGRSIIERSFGILKARWRSIFFKALEVKPDFAVQVITCCAVLHNLCMVNGDILEPVEGAVVPDDTAVVQDEDDPQNGEHMRSHLAAALTGSSLRCLLLPGPGCLSCSGSGAEIEEASAETVEGSPQDEVIRQGGLMDGFLPIASSIRENHFTFLQ
ncbi:hypothetical protein SKAU_G00413730 [Synaphobranchus kaupii]|uniref:DDE Tnp4 domain-containing protein n=1 Tax=Synaphobranchus kaupii TaxID=118154 RepID=A0A9Q1E896_SYNKA|nr:hypothetical protein SKAU_G00413730 [Synaphobranchus kaupii]